MINLFIVDNEAILVNCLQQMVHNHPHIRFVGSAADGQAAVERIPAIQMAKGDCLVVLMDIQMPGMDGFEATTQLRQLRPDVRTVLFSGFSNLNTMNWSLHHAGCFISKNSSSEEILKAIERAANGETTIIGNAVSDPLMEHLGPELPPQPVELSAYHRAVLKGIMEGKTMNAIAVAEGTTLKSVESAKHAALDRLGVPKDKRGLTAILWVCRRIGI